MCELASGEHYQVDDCQSPVTTAATNGIPEPVAAHNPTQPSSINISSRSTARTSLCPTTPLSVVIVRRTPTLS
jgi:hypothetical protein